MIELERYWYGLGTLALLIASVHLYFPSFDRRYSRHQDRWLGFTGGIAIGYVILYMLPKLGALTLNLLPPGTELDLVKLQIYLLMLSAIVLELVTLHAESISPRHAGVARGFDYVVHGLYSFLVGYVLIELSRKNLIADLAIAMTLALHLVGMTHIFRERHRAAYDARIRWIYLALVITGALLGLITQFPKPLISGITAFLAGIILVNVISEELPMRHRHRLPWFLLGVVVFLAAGMLILGLGDPIVPVKG